MYNLKKLACTLALVGVLLILFLARKHILLFLAPFLTAIAISTINEPIINCLEVQLHIKRKPATIIMLILSMFSLAIISALMLLKIYNELIRLQNDLPNYITSISYLLSGYYSKATSLYNALPYGMQQAFIDNIPKLEGIIGSVASAIITGLSSLPKLMVFITITLLSSYIISTDRENIRRFIYKRLPQNAQKKFFNAKNNASTSILGYFKAQLIMMLVTLAISTLGFIIIQADYAVLMGIITALADGIPLLGSGIVMLPWITLCLLSGKVHMAIGLAGVYLLAIIVRQILEPKLIAKQTGLHPLVTLISMYSGMVLFGVMGMFLGPVIAILLKNIYLSGIISTGKQSP